MFRILLREPRMNMPRYIRRHQAAHPTPEIYDYLSRFSAVCGKTALVVLRETLAPNVSGNRREAATLRSVRVSDSERR